MTVCRAATGPPANPGAGKTGEMGDWGEGLGGVQSLFFPLPSSLSPHRASIAEAVLFSLLWETQGCQEGSAKGNLSLAASCGAPPVTTLC